MDLKDIKKPEDILTIKPTEIETKTFKYLFGMTKDGQRFKPNTPFILKKDQYLGLTSDVKTCMGNYMINRTLFNDNVVKIVGYVNKRFNSDTIEEVESKLAKALLNDKITVPDLIYYMDRIQFFGFSLSSAFAPSLTEKTVFMPESVFKEKARLIKENIANINDPMVSTDIQKQIIKKAKEVIGKDDPGMDLYESGSKASFGNNFAKIFLMNGSMLDMETGDFKTSTSSYFEGVTKSEMDLYANAMVEGCYAKGVGTQQGGYLVKKYNAAFQSVVLDKPKTDCGTQKTLAVSLTKDNHKMFLYRYIKEGQKKVLIDEDNIKNYINKNIQLYDPLFCVGNKICNKCAGEIYYKLGIENIGLTASKVCSSIMNKSLKKFHDRSLKIHEVDNIEELYD